MTWHLIIIISATVWGGHAVSVATIPNYPSKAECMIGADAVKVKGLEIRTLCIPGPKE